MLGVGWVMFWKAIVIAVWIALVARYRAMKAKRRQRGVVLEYDYRRRTYFDPLERWETRIRLALYVVGAVFALYAAFVFYVILVG